MPGPEPEPEKTKAGFLERAAGRFTEVTKPFAKDSKKSIFEAPFLLVGAVVGTAVDAAYSILKGLFNAASAAVNALSSPEPSNREGKDWGQDLNQADTGTVGQSAAQHKNKEPVTKRKVKSPPLNPRLVRPTPGLNTPIQTGGTRRQSSQEGPKQAQEHKGPT